MPDGWLLVRGSNTEPIVRVVAEAKSETQAREMVNSLMARIKT
jgi:phosphomannomutase